VAIALGPSIDRLGVRSALLVGGVASLLGRLMLTGASSPWTAAAGLLVFQTIGSALAYPVMRIGVRYVLPESELALGYSLMYAAMQVGAIAAGVLTDAIVPGATLSDGLSLLLASTCLSSMLYIGLVFAHVDVVALPLATHEQPAALACAAETRQVCRDSVFWRLVLFALVMTGSRTIWRHVDVSLPKFILRTLGAHARYGDVYAVNPFVTMLLVTPVQLAVAHVRAYTVIVVGVALTTLAPLVLYWFTPSYTALIGFMIVLSLGEVLYSPRVDEFTMRMAPRGREGIYSALTTAPLFVVRFAIGAASGALLGYYCPATEPVDVTQCMMMWLVVAATAATTPVALIVLKRHLDVVADDATCT